MRSIGRIQAAPLRRGGMPNPAWKCGLNSLEIHCFYGWKKHTHTHIYIYSIYIHNCIDMTQKGKDMKAKNQKRHVFCEKKLQSLSLSRRPSAKSFTTSRHWHLRGITQHWTKRKGSAAWLCSLWRMPRPAVMNLEKKKTGPLNKKGGKQVAFVCMI